MSSGIHTLSRSLRSLALPVAVLALLAAAPLTAAAETTFTFKGGGWGHGIGMSQWGARGYALAGKSYTWILEHYYQDTRLVTRDAPTVRVNLDANAHARSSWQIQAGSTTPLVVAQVGDSTSRISLDATSTYWITTSGGNTRVHSDLAYEVDGVTKHKPGNVLRTFSGQCYVGAGGLVRIVSASGPFNHTRVAWRGVIRFIPTEDTKSKAVNFVGIEQYLYGVVPRESPSSWPAEALKAQAVAARSYAYQDAKDERTIYCTTMSQVYNGHSRPGTAHEAASTNSAVDATRGKVVWYGSETKPVRTFFFASSGGHTADIEHVWTESTPRPYYRGVADADSDSPHYRWTFGPLSASSVSSKIRAKDAGSGGLDYSAPYPSTITGMSLERGSDGFTHHVTLRWSNGASYRVRGDTIRSALGLRSTKFWLINLDVYREQSDTRVAWAGPWKTVWRSASYGGSSRRVSAAESRIWLTYRGTGFKWVGTKAASFGRASVYVDGTYRATVDAYSPKTVDRQTLFSVSGQRDTTHTVSIRVRGSKRSASSGTWVDVDRFAVTAGDLIETPVPVGRIEDTHSYLTSFGTWQPGTSGSEDGSTRWTTTAGDRMVVTFVGDRIKWYARAGSNRGVAKVTLDRGMPVIVDSYTSAPQENRVVWTSPKLPWGVHTVAIEALGVHSSASTGNHVSVEAFEIGGGSLRKGTPLPVRMEESSPHLAWSGSWGRATDSRYSDGALKWSNTAGAKVTADFTGTAVSWRGVKAPSFGKAAVYLDGLHVATVNCYSSTTKRQALLFSRSALTPGEHTLEIKVLGYRSSVSSGNTVAVDAIDVSGWPR